MELQQYITNRYIWTHNASFAHFNLVIIKCNEFSLQYFSHHNSKRQGKINNNKKWYRLYT